MILGKPHIMQHHGPFGKVSYAAAISACEVSAEWHQALYLWLWLSSMVPIGGILGVYIVVIFGINAKPETAN